MKKLMTEIKYYNFMLVLIIVIYYYMDCLLTISIDYKKKIMNSDVSVFCSLPKLHHISDVLMDFHWFPVRQRSLNFNLLGKL